MLTELTLLHGFALLHPLLQVYSPSDLGRQCPYLHRPLKLSVQGRQCYIVSAYSTIISASLRNKHCRSQVIHLGQNLSSPVLTMYISSTCGHGGGKIPLNEYSQYRDVCLRVVNCPIHLTVPLTQDSMLWSALSTQPILRLWVSRKRRMQWTQTTATYINGSDRMML